MLQWDKKGEMEGLIIDTEKGEVRMRVGTLMLIRVHVDMMQRGK